MFQGRIVKALSGFYYVEDNNKIIECRARGKFRKDEIKPLVGDFVEYQDGYIMKLLPRKNFLVRPPICNIDQVLIVNSCKEPDFSSMLLDKFLLVVEHLNIEPIIVLSKMDLDDGSVESYVNDYRKAGYKVYALGRGKHTTRHVELIKMYNGYIGDTPGFSSLELDMSPEQLAIAYHDFKEYSQECKFRGCLHDKEPDCAIKKAVDDGMISKERYEHYLLNLQEVKRKEERKYG